jgi:PAS domain S-box-containing protein
MVCSMERGPTVLAITTPYCLLLTMNAPVTERRLPGNIHFRQIADSARHFAIISMDLEGRVTFWNAGAVRLLGRSADDMLGNTIHCTFTPEDVAAGVPEQEIADALAQGYGSDERWHLRQDGERFWASGEVTPLLNDHGKVYGFSKIMQDRTPEKNYEIELQAMASELEGLLKEKTRERDRLWRNSLDLLLEISPQGYLTAINPAWKTVLGYEEADLLRQHFGPFVHPDDIGKTVEAIAAASTGPLVNFEVRIKHKAGGYRHIAWSAAPEEGYIYANGRDITTEKRQAELLSAHAQARLRLALEAGDMGVWEWDMRNGQLSLLEGAAALHGVSGAAPVTVLPSMHDYLKGVHPDDRAQLQEKIGLALSSGGEHRIEYRILLPEGGTRWLEARGTVLRNESGEPSVMHGVSVDISLRKRVELDTEFLSQASAQLAALVDPQSTLDKIAKLAVPNFADWCAIDLVQDGQLTRLAVAHVESAKAALGHELHRRFPPAQSDKTGAWQIVRTMQPHFVPRFSDETLRQAIPESETERLVLLRKLGIKSYIGVPLVTHGEVIGVLTFVTSKSGKIYTREDLELAQELARRAATAIDNAKLYQAVQQADRDKDVFLATLAHELRNPLAALSNAVTLMGLQARDPSRLENIQQVMQRQVRQLSRLVDDLLDISRIATGKIELRREPANLGMIINHAVEASRPLIEAAGHQLSLIYPDKPVEVNGDVVRLTQVFANLLNNAAKFTTGSGRIEVKVECSPGECAVHIIDTGIGIEPDMLPQVFKLFSQGRQPENRVASGLGIGLSLVQRLVQMHGGRVVAESEGRGKGSEFIVYLPTLVREDAASGAHLQEKSLHNGWWNGKSILVVDDNIDAATMLGEVLRAFGARVRTVHDGPSALAAVDAEMPEAILLDIGMPIMDGFEVARRLRAAYPDREMLLIALTGWGQAHDKNAALDAGFAMHWVKPVSFVQLRDFRG